MDAGTPMLPIFPISNGEMWGSYSHQDAVLCEKFNKGLQDVTVVERSLESGPEFFLSPEFRAHITFLAGDEHDVQHWPV